MPLRRKKTAEILGDDLKRYCSNCEDPRDTRYSDDLTMLRQPAAENSFIAGPIPAHEVSYSPDGEHYHTWPPKMRVVLPHMDGDRPFLFQPGHRTEIRFA